MMNTDIEDQCKEYLKTFKVPEREAAKAATQLICKICSKVTGWTDVVNYENFINVVCPECKEKYQTHFDMKKVKWILERAQTEKT